MWVLLAIAGVLFHLLAGSALAGQGQHRGPGPDSGSRIVGGWDASSSGHDWMVSLQVTPGVAGGARDDFGRHFCGGSLIAPMWVLTAAHCVQNDRRALGEPSTWSAVLGETDLIGDTGTRIQVREIVVHPGYDARTNRHDIALMRLDRAATGFAFMPLAQSGDGELSEAGDEAYAMGWGSTSDGGVGDRDLQEAYLPVLDDARCEDADSSVYDGYDRAGMLCGGHLDGGIDTCQGDSGGPLFTYDGGQIVQIGIVSYGDGCAQADLPGVYTRVGHYFDWIRGRVGGRRLDLVFALDTTGSMWDDIFAVQVTSRMLTAVYGLLFDLRVGIVEFKDHPVEGGDSSDYPARVALGLGTDFTGFRATLDGLVVDGGGDWPESVYSGVMAALRQPWRADTRRAVVLFGDAPPKNPEPVTGFTHADVVRAARAGLVEVSSRVAPAPGELGPDSVGVFALKVNDDPDTAEAFDALAQDTGAKSLQVDGAADVAAELSELLGALAAEPVASAGGPYAGVVGTPVVLEGRGRDDDGTVASLAWDIGADGTVEGAGGQYAHTFDRAGVYPVRLTVTDDDGLRGFALTTVTVADSPGPALSGSAPPGDAGPGVAPVRPRVSLSKITVDRRLRSVRLRVACVGTAPCRGAVRVDALTGRDARTSAVRRLARAEVRLPTTRPRVVTIALGRKARSAMRRNARRNRIRLRVAADLRDASGSRATATRRFTVRVPSRR